MCDTEKKKQTRFLILTHQTLGSGVLLPLACQLFLFMREGKALSVISLSYRDEGKKNTRNFISIVETKEEFGSSEIPV